MHLKQGLMRKSCHFNRPPNAEIGVKYRVFVIFFIFFTMAEVCILGHLLVMFEFNRAPVIGD